MAIVLRGPFAAPRASRNYLLLLAFALAAAAVISLGLALAQSSGNGVYDTDDDRLIEISNIEQLDAMRHDNNGDGNADNAGVVDAYAVGFPLAEGELVCDRSCNGYELARSLDFNDPASYRSGSVNTDFTRGAGFAPNWAFGAIFDGNGFTVSSLYINSSLIQFSRTNDQYNTGLFGWIDSSAIIRNVGLLNVEVTGDSDVGGLVGWNQGSVSRSYVTGGVRGSAGEIGGLVGENHGYVSLSYSKATVSGTTARSGKGIGGLVGSNHGGRIEESYATGNVNGSGYSVGGLVGYSSGAIASSYATGDVAAATATCVGGLVGYNTGAIASSYAMGSVSGKVQVGGLVGILTSHLTTSYSTGSVSGTSRIGGLVGSVISGARTTHSSWDIEASGVATSIHGVGFSTAEMTSPTSNTNPYGAWDPKKWDFGTSSQYPALKADINGDGIATAVEFGGQGRDRTRPQPTLAPTPEHFVDFFTGAGHICLLRDDGSVECSGENSHGQASPPAGVFYALNGGDTWTCGLSTEVEGDVVCWGSISGTFTLDNPPPTPTPTPVPVATPTPQPGAALTPTPGSTPGATLTPTPQPAASSCVEALPANNTVTRTWDTGCQSTDRSGSYARWYTFTLDQDSAVTISLESTTDTYLYLRSGNNATSESGSTPGRPQHENDDHTGGNLADDTDSQIATNLTAGTYTIEATTFTAGQTGSFTLTVEVRE